jgi:hypothetical protein
LFEIRYSHPRQDLSGNIFSPSDDKVKEYGNELSRNFPDKPFTTESKINSSPHGCTDTKNNEHDKSNEQGLGD